VPDTTVRHATLSLALSALVIVFGYLAREGGVESALWSSLISVPLCRTGAAAVALSGLPAANQAGTAVTITVMSAGLFAWPATFPVLNALGVAA
jgi:hypothetical protein